MQTLFSFLIFLLSTTSIAQTFGPNDPANSGNQASPGGLTNWTGINNIKTSNNSRATCASKTVTNYAIGVNYGFNLLSTDLITGIQMDIEKRSSGLQDVSVLNDFTLGLTKTVNAGVNRYLVVCVSSENQNLTTVTGVTYGGQAMTFIRRENRTGGFSAGLEFYGLNDAGITAATSTLIAFTTTSAAYFEYFDIVASASFQNVDQIDPVPSAMISSASEVNIGNWLFPTANPTMNGSYTIAGVFTGGNPSGLTGTAVANAYTCAQFGNNPIDQYSSNVVQPTAGGVLAIFGQASPAAATIQPTFVLPIALNRQVAVLIGLQRARNTDENVYLTKNNGATTTPISFAINTEWPTVDAYVSYGGPAILWGSTWLYSDVNSNQFGGLISARVENGSAQIDHMRITVYTVSVLPVKLLSFTTTSNLKNSYLNWSSGSESRLSHYQIQRSFDGINFQTIANVDAVGNSTTIQNYSFTDYDINAERAYYRLIATDDDKSEDVSETTTVTFKPNETIIFPNPANNWIEVQNTMDINSYFITDLQGNLIDTNVDFKTDNSLKLNITDFPTGKYLLGIKTANGIEVKSFSKVSN